VSGHLQDAPADEAARRRAATLFDRNLVVTAGAGTGKTALLVERLLNLIAGAGVPIASLAAITFTDKAAAELRERLAVALDDLRALAIGGSSAVSAAESKEAALCMEARRAFDWLRSRDGGPTPGEIADRALQALVSLDAASVSTLHAFCSEILRRYPRESRVDPTFAIDEGAAFDRIFEEEWERFLASELGVSPPRAPLWRKALALPGALESIREIGRALASFEIPEAGVSPATRRRAATPAARFGGEVERLCGTLERILRDASGLNPHMARFLQSSRQFLATVLERGPEAMGSAEAPVDLDAYLRRRPPQPGRKLANLDPDEVNAAAARARELIAAFSGVREETLDALIESARPLAAACRERLLQAGFASFDALLRLTRDLLARHPDIRRLLASRYRAILVDEFQDTDPLQYEILFFIAEEEGDRAEDAYQARLEPGRLFIVGDPKQSIYRFRGADIEAYRRAVDHLLACGGEELHLSASFRSPAEIVEPINLLFGALIGPAIPEDEPFEPRYDPIVSHRGAAGDGRPHVEIWSVESGGNVEERRRAEAAAIAAWIARQRDGGARAGERYRPKQIAILLRALTSAGFYLQALRRAEIPYVVDGGRDFYERREVGDLIAFLRAAHNPHEGAAVLAVLRGPLGGVPDDELARFAASGGRFDPPRGTVDEAAFPNLARAFAFLESFRTRTRGRAPDAVIEKALDETPIAMLHASAFDGAQRLANLRKMVARAAAHARAGLSLEETLRVIEDEQRGERAEGESPVADESVDAVRVLSVHKAKGLEYPVVFVPDVGREARRRPAAGTEVAWDGRGAGQIAVRLADGVSNLAWVLHADSARRHEWAEEKRVLYVACTRARERLVLVNSNPSKRSPWRDALAALGYKVEGGYPAEGPLRAGVMHRRVVPDRPAPRVARRQPSPVWSEAALRFQEAITAALAAARPAIRRPAESGGERLAPGDLAGGAADSLQDDARGAPRRDSAAGREVARAAGTAIHGALERWDFRDAARLRVLVARQVTHVVASERDGILQGVQAREVARAAEEILEAFLASPLPARLAAVEVLGREVPILFRDGAGTVWVGACDLVFRDTDGTVVAADYKSDRTGTARAGTGGGLTEAELAERYRPQVGVYVEALRRSLPGAAVRGELLFLRSGAAVEIAGPFREPE
jgi:ATP-dependent helicase/nuclease subunit A